MALHPKLEKAAGLYSLPNDDTAQLAFAAVAGCLIKEACRKMPRLFRRMEAAGKLTAIDVGCGYFRYGVALKAVLSSINPNNEIYAVDRERLKANYPAALFVKADIAEFPGKYPKVRPDIVTVFNPFPRIPKLPTAFCAPVMLGCVDWNRKFFEESLEENGYRPLVWMENRWKREMEPWFNNYDPFVLAVRK
ncbi:hypothetical protein HYY74_03665 [Candidatus Woesearchaeota archaeon]|nr:hypothetical protein [Candidatus Woesearchaeota archaeon]